MSTQGWIDVHGHFFLPYKSEDEKRAVVEALCKNDFLVSEAPRFDPEGTIAHLDQAGVALQLLSYLPPALDRLRAANDYAATIVAKYPSRFGLLAALPTYNPQICLEEIDRVTNCDQGGYHVLPDGFATSTVYNGIGLGDPILKPVWRDLDSRRATVHVHPNAYAPGIHSRPSPLIEVAFDTARTIVDMLYQRVFSTYPNINFIFAHCGGALPVLTGRVALLGAETWVRNPNGVTSEEFRSQIASLWFDTAATAETGLQPAAKVAGIEHCVYGSDCGVPCSTDRTMEINRADVMRISEELSSDKNLVGRNAWKLFPDTHKRAFATQ